MLQLPVGLKKLMTGGVELMHTAKFGLIAGRNVISNFPSQMSFSPTTPSSSLSSVQPLCFRRFITLPTCKLIRGYEQEFSLKNDSMETLHAIDDIGKFTINSERTQINSQILFKREGLRLDLSAETGSHRDTENNRLLILNTRPEFGRTIEPDLSGQGKEAGPVYSKSAEMLKPNSPDADKNAVFSFGYAFPIIEPWRLKNITLKKRMQIIFEYNTQITNNLMPRNFFSPPPFFLSFYTTSPVADQTYFPINHPIAEEVQTYYEGQQEVMFDRERISSETYIWKGKIDFKKISEVINQGNFELDHTGLACQTRIWSMLKLQFNRVVVSMTD